MGFLTNYIGFILHLDSYLGIVIQNYGALTYIIFFLLIFCETGLVITPFLPGDSLIFIAGTFAAKTSINVILLFFVLTLAAILGDNFNYLIGKYIGEKLLKNTRLVKRGYIEKTKEFYKRHGGKTIVLARFIPVIRTFAPFVAGIGKMDYLTFLSFNIVGGVFWIATFVFGGYYFGRIKFVQQNLSWVILAIIFLSVLPIIIEFLKKRIKN